MTKQEKYEIFRGFCNGFNLNDCLHHGCPLDGDLCMILSNEGIDECREEDLTAAVEIINGIK